MSYFPFSLKKMLTNALKKQRQKASLLPSRSSLILINGFQIRAAEVSGQHLYLLKPPVSWDFSERHISSRQNISKAALILSSLSCVGGEMGGGLLFSRVRGRHPSLSGSARHPLQLWQEPGHSLLSCRARGRPLASVPRAGGRPGGLAPTEGKQAGHQLVLPPLTSPSSAPVQNDPAFLSQPLLPHVSRRPRNHLEETQVLQVSK